MVYLEKKSSTEKKEKLMGPQGEVREDAKAADLILFVLSDRTLSDFVPVKLDIRGSYPDRSSCLA